MAAGEINSLAPERKHCCMFTLSPLLVAKIPFLSVHIQVAFFSTGSPSRSPSSSSVSTDLRTAEKTSLLPWTMRMWPDCLWEQRKRILSGMTKIAGNARPIFFTINFRALKSIDRVITRKVITFLSREHGFNPCIRTLGECSTRPTLSLF